MPRVKAWNHHFLVTNPVLKKLQWPCDLNMNPVNYLNNVCNICVLGLNGFNRRSQLFDGTGKKWTGRGLTQSV